MLPLRDNIPSRSFPIVTVGLILANTLAFLYELSLGSGLKQFILEYGLVPARLTQQGAVAIWPSAFTSMFLHGGWMHLLGNMWYLWLFGDNIEDRMGKAKFLIFYLLGGFAAALAQVLSGPHSMLPTIGASGAIAAVLGAYAVTYPGARVLTLVIIFFFLELIELPALLVLGGWFFLQMLNGAAAIASVSATSGGVAWFAHIGGFIFGAVACTLFKRRIGPPPQLRSYRWEDTY